MKVYTNLSGRKFQIGDRVVLWDDIEQGRGSRTKHRTGTVVALSTRPDYVYVQQDGCSVSRNIWHVSFWRKMRNQTPKIFVN